MPFKLIGTILLVIFIVVLTGFNLSNTCSVWFFHTFPNVPVFAMIIGSFVLGVIVTLPFTFGKKRMQKKLEKAKQDLEEKQKELEAKALEVKSKFEKDEMVESSTDESSTAETNVAEQSATESPVKSEKPSKKTKKAKK